jgi:hypothetical protein
LTPAERDELSDLDSRDLGGHAAYVCSQCHRLFVDATDTPGVYVYAPDGDMSLSPTLGNGLE